MQAQTPLVYTRLQDGVVELLLLVLFHPFLPIGGKLKRLFAPPYARLPILPDPLAFAAPAKLLISTPTAEVEPSSVGGNVCVYVLGKRSLTLVDCVRLGSLPQDSEFGQGPGTASHARTTRDDAALIRCPQPASTVVALCASARQSARARNL